LLALHSVAAERRVLFADLQCRLIIRAVESRRRRENAAADD
jgi:hypothetical protein